MKVKNIINTFVRGEFLIKLKCKFFIKSELSIIKERQLFVYNKFNKKYKEIIEKSNYVYKKSEESNYIWICWLQGYEKAPDIVKACIDSIKKHFPEKEIIILTNDNINKYVDFNDSITQKYNKGIISRTHFSDLLRIELLCKYGGIWVDSTVLCTSDSIKDILNRNDFFVFKELDLSRAKNRTIVASNWFIYSKYKEHPILMLTRDLLIKYWEDYNYLMDYFIFHILFTISANHYKEDWDKVETYNNHSPHILMFELDKKYSKNRFDEIKKMSFIHKLQWHNDYSNIKDSFWNYLINSYKEEK